MDKPGIIRYFPAIMAPTTPIPVWQLYGEDSPFPDVMHIERIMDRAAGLDWQIAPHRHLHLHQVFLIQSGQIRLHLDGQTIASSEPVMMNIPRHTVHGFQFSAGTEGYVLTVPATDFPEIFATGTATHGALARPFVGSVPQGMPDGFALIQSLHGTANPFRTLRLRAAVIALACAVAETSERDSPDLGFGDPRIARFEAMIRMPQAQGWHLGDYARALGISERHLRRLCLDATGKSARHLIEATHLREACRLLAYTRMRVQDVGFALGYDDPAYFARVFRRATGLSPGDYRARLEQ
jgi:AraC family transcriptional regulator, transcriptional activator of pobA